MVHKIHFLLHVKNYKIGANGKKLKKINPNEVGKGNQNINDF